MKRILVVDDEADLVKVIEFRLKEAKYEVLTAFDGQEGLAKARKEAPEKEDREWGEKVKANAYMTKPFDPPALIAKVKELIGE